MASAAISVNTSPEGEAKEPNSYKTVVKSLTISSVSFVEKQGALLET